MNILIRPQNKQIFIATDDIICFPFDRTSYDSIIFGIASDTREFDFSRHNDGLREQSSENFFNLRAANLYAVGDMGIGKHVS